MSSAQLSNNPAGKKVNTQKVNTGVFTFLRLAESKNFFLLLAVGFYVIPTSSWNPKCLSDTERSQQNDQKRHKFFLHRAKSAVQHPSA